MSRNTLQPPSITQGNTSTASVSVSWSQVSNATGYYVSYQRRDLGSPPVVTPQYERIVGGDNTSVTLSGLEPGTTYRIRVWSTDGASVSSEAGEMDVTTVESGKDHAWCSQITGFSSITIFCSLHFQQTSIATPPPSPLPTTHADHDWRTNWEYH